MSTISAGIKQALTALQSGAGQSTLAYRVNRADSWHVFTGFLLPGPTQLIGYDEQHNAIMMPTSARLKVPTDGVHLAPGSAGVPGAEIQDVTGGTIWAVVGSDHSVGQSLYLLQRAPVLSQGSARNGLAV